MLTTENLGLIGLLLLGLAARSELVAGAAALLLMLRFTKMTFVLPTLERRGVEIGLLFLTIAMLVPFAQGLVSMKEIGRGLVTLPGILAIIGGMVATRINGQGLRMLNQQSHLMISLIVGSILGIVVLGGIPVGPLMAAGVTYLLLEGISLVTHWFH
ncbi:DUF441 domain-containing protein [Sulfobacillus harzensis]|uniref:UPF0756 membrane protein HIJ39_21865 n=1 Tax=Sulfobacillus harzensis TaxID=2729629 RepID=A0A7Y0L8H7_9FIRM|nr:DUF441 domain-containing protein [Sulfobacillus harzensis]NMP24958.1 DUF441 domain-containing protein [Sulfobacillus harzensis]